MRPHLTATHSWSVPKTKKSLFMLVPMAIVLRMMLAIHMGAIAIVFVLRRFFLLLVWFVMPH